LVEGQLLSRRVEADVVADGHTERDSEAGAKRDGIREAGLLVPVSDAVRVLARVVGVHLMVLGKKLPSITQSDLRIEAEAALRRACRTLPRAVVRIMRAA